MIKYVLVTVSEYLDEPHVMLYKEELKYLAGKHYDESNNKGSKYYLYETKDGCCKLISKKEIK